MMSVQLSPSSELWATFVNANTQANVFHHPTWIQLLADCYGYQPLIFAVCDNIGQIQAGFPVMVIRHPLKGQRWVSLPFTDHCTPLYRTDESLRILFASLLEQQIEGIIPQLELKSSVPPCFHASSNEEQVLHLLRLSPDPQAVLRTFKRTLVQNRIRKAERDGVKVCWAQNRQDLDTFYALHWQTRQRLGVPVQPRRYFEMLWQRLIKPGLGFILLAYKNSVPIAGGVFLAYKTTLMYKYGASDRDYWNLSPNHALFWTAIRWGCENGYTIFDWGKTEVMHTSLRDFKRTWNAEEKPLPYSILPAPHSCAIGEHLKNLFGKMIFLSLIPSSSPQITGKFLSLSAERIIQRSPASVCRITGELLYKYFA